MRAAIRFWSIFALLWAIAVRVQAQDIGPWPVQGGEPLPSSEVTSPVAAVTEPVFEVAAPSSEGTAPEATTPGATAPATEGSGIVPAGYSDLANEALMAPEARSFDAGYDNGIFLRTRKQSDSFEIKVNLRSQFRVVSFSRAVDSWTDSAGVVRPVRNREYFDLERGRLILSGHILTPQFKYFLQLNGDTDNQSVVSIFDGWVSWHFSDAFEVQVGKRKVPGTRNWTLGAFDTRLVDRPFSNEFFRPARTTGIWAIGNPTPAWHYELMVGQGYNTEGLTPAELSNNFALASQFWWDAIGSYGPARPMDFEFHDELAVRVGGSWAWSQEGEPGRALEEADFLRLTDGTRLTETGALAPGVTVRSFDVTLFAVDAAFKYRGWSANAEYFWRTVDHLGADGPVPSVGLQHGCYLEGGCFLLPQKFEVNAQTAFTSGKAGSTASYTGGCSYYPRKSQHLKLSVDVTHINGSPVNSTGTDILVGDNGTLIRTQLQAVF